MIHFHRLIALCFACLICSMHVTAQVSVVGVVEDSSGHGLPYANLVLLNRADSSLAAFASTNNKGSFKLAPNAGANGYLLRVSFIGYESHTRNLQIDENDQLLDLGKITLHEQGYLLDGAEINGYRIPIRMRGDTVVFDADAFSTGPNAVVDDLLRQLPGLSIQAGGQILFRGKPVNEVMVNGRPFFRGNTQLLTQNLTAAAVKNVEVYDRKSSAETVSGEDDGREDLTVNLTIKPEAEGDPFGEVYAGVGTDQRYKAGGKAFRISGKQQLGAVATINNLNQTGLSYSDLASIGQTSTSSGGSIRIPIQNGSQVLGENRTIAGGLNQSAPLGENANTTVSYLLYDVSESMKATETNRYADPQLGEQVITKKRDTKSYLHRLALDYEFQRDTSAWFTARIDGELTGRRLGSESQVSWVRENDNSAYLQNDAGRDRFPRLFGRMDYSQRLDSAGKRSIALWTEILHREEAEQLTTDVSGLGSASMFLADGTRNWKSVGNTWGTEGQFSFRQNLSQHWSTTAAVDYSAQQTRSYTQLQRSEANTVDFQSAHTLVTPSVRFRRKLPEGHVSFGLGRQFLDWNLTGDLTRRTRRAYWAPALSYAGKAGSARVNLTLQGSPEMPRISDLLTLPDLSGLNEVRLGSPNLKPAYRYQVNGSYSLFNQFAGFNLFANARAAHIDSSIGYALDLRGEVPVTQALNFDYAREYSGYLRLSQLFAPLRLTTSIESSLVRRSGPSILNDAAVMNTSTSWMSGLRVQRSLGEDGFVSLGYRLRQVESGFEESNYNRALTQELSLSGEVQLAKRVRLGTDFTHQQFSSSSDGPSIRSLPLWDFNLEFQMWQDKPHYLTFTAVDLLDQNRGVQQQALGLLIRETQSNALGRYLMVGAHWRL